MKRREEGMNLIMHNIKQKGKLIQAHKVWLNIYYAIGSFPFSFSEIIFSQTELGISLHDFANPEGQE